MRKLIENVINENINYQLNKNNEMKLTEAFKYDIQY